MKKWLLTLATALSAASALEAQPCDDACYNWCPVPCSFQGFYVGGNVGFASLRFDLYDQDGFFNLANHTNTTTGWVAGIQVGYDWQFCNKLLGLVVDWDWSNANAGIHIHPHPLSQATTVVNFNWKAESRLQWFTTIRARGGLVLNDLLLYLTAGGVVGDFRTLIRSITTPPPLSQLTQIDTRFDKHRWGWTVGFGGEYAFCRNWSLSAEVLFMRFQRKVFTESRNITISEITTTNIYGFELHNDVWVGRLGLNYRFSLCDFW